MSIMVLKETKEGEGRVIATPADVRRYKEYTPVCVEHGAGTKCGILDNAYGEAGAELHNREGMNDAAQLLSDPLIMKVKELLPPEFHFLKPNTAVMGFGHLASNEALTRATIACESTYLSIEDIIESGRRPVLADMSKVAGEEAVRLSRKHLSGAGFAAYILIGYGNAGQAAHRELSRQHIYNIQILDIDTEGAGKMSHFNSLSNAMTFITKYSVANCEEIVMRAIRIGRGTSTSESPLAFILSPYIPESTAPKILRRNILPMLPRGSVIVDISIDQGGACEFSRVTSHEDPVADISGVKYIGIPNLPGGAPETATLLLSDAVQPYALEIAEKGFVGAIRSNAALRGAVSIYRGRVTSAGLAKTFGLEYVTVESLLA